MHCRNGRLVKDAPIETAGYCRDGNNRPYRNVIWGRRCRSAGCHEAGGTTETTLARSLSALPPDERGWITFSEARILFSSKGAQYAFGETDQDGRKNIESFAAKHRSVVNFMPFDERVYFVSGGNNVRGLGDYPPA